MEAQGDEEIGKLPQSSERRERMNVAQGRRLVNDRPAHPPRLCNRPAAIRLGSDLDFSVRAKYAAIGHFAGILGRPQVEDSAYFTGKIEI
jgi:hypothetical protein